MKAPHRNVLVSMLAGAAALAFAGQASAADATLDPVSGKLTVEFAGNDKAMLGQQIGNVTLNGDVTPIIAADVKTIDVVEDAADTEANAINLSGIDLVSYTQLQSTLIQAAGGADDITGSPVDDRIVGGKQNDTMRGGDGDDTLVWNNGDGSDVMNGGDGIDTIENNGADTAAPNRDEVYTVETVGPRFKFSRTSTGPFTLDVGGAEAYVNNLLGGYDRFSTLDQTQPVRGIAVTLNGGAGDDDLAGTDGGDTINGGPGADKLTGFKGNDTVNGDAGDDLLVWNNGDGSDKNEGGDGTDVAQLNGGNAGEHFVITGNGARVTATRDTQVPFFLDTGTVETFDLNGGDGDDSADIGAGVGQVLATDIDMGAGNDTVHARNDSAQKIDGGDGTDSAQVDATDTVTHVETVDAPAAQQPPADTDAPELALLSMRMVVSGGRATVRISCPAGETACTGTAKILRKGKVVGNAQVDLAGGETRTLRIQLNRRTRIALAKASGRKLRVTLEIEVADEAGNTGVVSKRFNLKG